MSHGRGGVGEGRGDAGLAEADCRGMRGEKGGLWSETGAKSHG